MVMTVSGDETSVLDPWEVWNTTLSSLLLGRLSLNGNTSLIYGTNKSICKLLVYGILDK